MGDAEEDQMQDETDISGNVPPTCALEKQAIEKRWWKKKKWRDKGAFGVLVSLQG